MKEMELFKLINGFLGILLQNKKSIKNCLFMFSLSPELLLIVLLIIKKFYSINFEII